MLVLTVHVVRLQYLHLNCEEKKENNRRAVLCALAVCDDQFHELQVPCSIYLHVGSVFGIQLIILIFLSEKSKLYLKMLWRIIG